MNTAVFRNPDALVTTGWLETHLNDPDLRVFDCTTYLEFEEGSDRPYKVVSGLAEYEKVHIPGSVYLDLQRDFSRSDSPYAFTLPSPQDVADAFARHGIGPGTKVVLYSRTTPPWATRFWWMLRWIGFDDAAILDGGFQKWAEEGRAVSTTAEGYPAASLTASERPGLFTDKTEMLASISDGATCTVNALSPDLHSGESDRYGRPGRIPGSVNVPALSLVKPGTMEVNEPAIVAQAFADHAGDPQARIITYCGGGIFATFNAYLLHQLGFENVGVYDNSMSEWATDDSLPMDVG